MAFKESEGEIVDESAEYSPKSEFSKPLVVMETVQKCINARAVEMKKGYYNTNISKDGLPIRIWIGDTRKVYVSCVTALRQLMIPEILDDDKYKEIKTAKEGGEEKHPLKIIDGKIKTARQEAIYEEYKLVHKDGKNKCEKTGYTYLPEIDSSVSMRKIFPDGNEALVEVLGAWNQKVNVYWDKVVELNDKIFEELMRVIHRKNYFKQAIRIG